MIRKRIESAEHQLGVRGKRTPSIYPAIEEYRQECIDRYGTDYPWSDLDCAERALTGFMLLSLIGDKNARQRVRDLKATINVILSDEPWLAKKIFRETKKYVLGVIAVIEKLVEEDPLESKSKEVVT